MKQVFEPNFPPLLQVQSTYPDRRPHRLKYRAVMIDGKCDEGHSEVVMADPAWDGWPVHSPFLPEGGN